MLDYHMLDHHIQRTIIHHLAFVPESTFTDLKPDTIENKLFTYHLKKTVTAGYVQKSDNGMYSLTAEGRRLSTGVQEKQQALVTERPLSALFLVIKNAQGQWLLYRRKTHPMLGYKGFMHVRPNALDSISQITKESVHQRTGLTGDFKPLGGGYVRIFQEQALESYTHFTLLYCNNIQGNLQQNDEHVEFFWADNPQWDDKSFFPTTKILKEKYEAGLPFFTEETFYI